MAAIVSRSPSPSPMNSSTDESIQDSIQESTEENLIPNIKSKLIKLEQATDLASRYIAELLQHKVELKNNIWTLVFKKETLMKFRFYLTL